MLILILSTRRNFRELKGQQRFARHADKLGREADAVSDGEQPGLAAAGAGGGRAGRVGVRWKRTDPAREFPGLGGNRLKRRIALAADVVEATVGFAGVDDVVRATLGTSDSEGYKRHPKPRAHAAHARAPTGDTSAPPPR